jgi:hypothetical protein
MCVRSRAIKIDIFDNQQRRFEKPRQPKVLADEQDLL